MPADVVLVRARVPPKDVQHPARVLERLAAVVALDEADHLRGDLALVLEASDLRSQTCQQQARFRTARDQTYLQAREKPERHLRLRVDELLLHELERRERPLELLPLERVLACPLHAVLERAHRAPRDAVARVVQAAKRRAEALAVREECVAGHGDVVHEDRAGERAAQGELVLDRGRGEALHALLEDEPADFVVPLAARPDDEDVAVVVESAQDSTGTRCVQ